MMNGNDERETINERQLTVCHPEQSEGPWCLFAVAILTGINPEEDQEGFTFVMRNSFDLAVFGGLSDIPIEKLTVILALVSTGCPFCR
jgi:hypothetical protein